MATPLPRKRRFFDGLARQTQDALDQLTQQEYEPDDGTDLNELAAKAYLIGFRNAAVLYGTKQKIPTA